MKISLIRDRKLSGIIAIVDFRRLGATGRRAGFFGTGTPRGVRG